MATFYDYLEKNGEFNNEFVTHDSKGFRTYEIKAKINENSSVEQCSIKLYVNGKEHNIVTEVHTIESVIRCLLEDEYRIEVRFCNECGIMMDSGYLEDGGFWYSCEDHFYSGMDKRFGKGKWRKADDKTIEATECFYEFLDDYNKEWTPADIFYTEWN